MARGATCIHMSDSYGFVEPDSDFQPDSLVTFASDFKPDESWTTASAYSDRMLSWNRDQFDSACFKVWGNHGQMFYTDRRNPDEIEKFLRLYFNKPELRLMLVRQHVNHATGFDLWFFAYAYPK